MMSYVSPALIEVYEVLPLSMYGQVRHLCLELQRNNLPARVSVELPVFASFERTSIRKATTKYFFVDFFKLSVE